MKKKWTQEFENFQEDQNGGVYRGGHF